MRWWFGLCLTWFFFTLAPSAAAQEVMIPQNLRDLANSVWHSPCNGQWRTYAEDPPVKGSPHDKSWYGSTIEPSDGCTIYLNPRYKPWKPGRRECQVVLHETGHAAGARHSKSPKSIMFPGYDGGVDVDPRCARLYPLVLWDTS